MKSNPQSPDELKAALAAIFPSLPRDFGAWGESVLAEAGPTCDSLLREFAEFLGRNIDQLPDRTLRRFAELVARCRSAGGPVAESFTRVLLPEAQADATLERLQGVLQDTVRRS